MAFYKEHLLQLSGDGFVIRPSYMDSHLSHGLRCAIGQIRTRVDLEGYHRRVGYAGCAIESQRQSYTTYATALCIMRYKGTSTTYLGRVLGP